MPSRMPPAVKFSAGSFIDPNFYLDYPETEESVQRYTRIINGQESNDLFIVRPSHHNNPMTTLIFIAIVLTLIMMSQLPKDLFIVRPRRCYHRSPTTYSL